MSKPLTTPEIMTIVNRYIGVHEGYLGDFTYRAHAEFYPEYCGLAIDPNRKEGTTRARFLEILGELEPRDQAKVVRGVVARFPVGGPGAPSTRTEQLRDELLAMAERLEQAGTVRNLSPTQTSEVVERAIADAERLIHTNGATSGVDRLHTALHGHLIVLCESSGIAVPERASATQLYRLLREQHPAFRPTGPRADDMNRILMSMITIFDALQPVRNMASVAHPNRELLDPPEAMLAINASRTILHYLDSRLVQWQSKTLRAPPDG